VVHRTLLGTSHGRRLVFWIGWAKKASAQQRQFFFTLPPLILSLPTLDLVFWVGKCASLPTQITKRKRELFNYHNTILFFHKIQGGQTSPKLFPKREIQGGQCPPNLFPGWACTAWGQVWLPAKKNRLVNNGEYLYLKDNIKYLCFIQLHSTIFLANSLLQKKIKFLVKCSCRITFRSILLRGSAERGLPKNYQNLTSFFGHTGLSSRIQAVWDRHGGNL